jgi:Diacylglycerol kinase catalytic domain
MQLETSNLKSGAQVPLVAIISNPLSTANAGSMDAIRSVIEQSANVVHFELNGIETVDEALALFARANPVMLIINGGDGTIGAVLASILYKKHFSVVPPIAFLPGGKTNMTAADLGSKGRPIKILNKLLKLAQEGRVAESLSARHLIEMDLGDGQLPRVGTFFGTAGIVKGIFWCREHAYSMGLPNSLAHLVSSFKLVTAALGIGASKTLLISDPMSINLPGQGRMAGQYSAVITTTLDRLILGIKPYSSEGSGGLRFSAVEAGGGNFIRAITGLLMGSFGKKSISGTHVRKGDEVRIEGSEPVTLDGEIYYPIAGKPVILRGDKALSFVAL